ncbi:wax ester/triacylglycerol synthase family O-acyltransferase [Pseudonocardia sp. WMMC193]|uniref:WS/DGAT/MGAT family O-acyltransferase n=1 Tax=Pseudonocardia sp. WMMC193 TaxID=2911965 RepID=UPI001F1877E6|nr:wax ester/triacylglycerol synthase family O-acyltransferase [Pseudonocardia sp. WMMC193]MCF7548499.1 wax ester/triacylglycerol synthase family O-acyltransferase [Pseudonocardia sp. WMMC193]
MPDRRPDRLSPLDASFLFMEERTTAMTLGAVMTFEPEDGFFDVDAFVDLIDSRLDLVPRYRQKVREVPGRLGLPVWVDDPDFDLSFHVRRSALPAPGTDADLRELVGRLLSRQLDRSRPLWEIYVIEGFEEYRVAILTKIHHAMVDGIGSMAVGSLLLDTAARPRPAEAGGEPGWSPRPSPSGLELATQAVLENMLRPRSAVDALTRSARDVREVASAVRRTLGGVADAVRTANHGRSVWALNAPIGTQRRFGMARTSLFEHRMIRRRHGAGGGTVNDVVLAVVAGALRRWLIARGEPIFPDSVVRAMVPVSVRGRGPGSDGGNRISAVFVELPVGDPDPVRRLQSIARQMEARKRFGRSAGTTAVVGLASLATPVMHEMGARLSSRLSSRLFNVVVTHVPGPPRPLYAMGARMRDMYPVVPLAHGQAVAIGVTSYDGTVCYGLDADRDALPDVDVLAEAVNDSLAELKEAPAA